MSAKSDIEREAIKIVENEKNQWEDAVAFVTEKVAFNMRNLIRQLRKNYWGIFNTPTDPTTGRKKIWVPLTESMVEAVVKNIDLDTKDINFRAKKPESQRLTSLVRAVVKNYLDNTFFGEDLDMLERDESIDGTAVWKTIEDKNDEGKLIPKRIRVDVLNAYIDPTAPSIQEAYRFTERSLMYPDEVMAMDWMNNKEIRGVEGLARIDGAFNNMGNTTDKLVDVWELWGKIPKWLITGKKKDEEEIDGHIIVSGIENPGQQRVHVLEENKKGKKPYEESWYTRISGRWYGKGIAEKVMMLQLWLNTIVNIRINRSYVSQLGIFKIKKGAGVTAQSISRLAANGAIVVNNMDDLEQLIQQEASQASYKDEEIINSWAQKVTSAFEVVTGEALPASTPATNAVIQSRNAQSQFVLVKEGLGMFLQRWIKRHVMPILMKNIKLGDLVRYSDDPDKLRSFDEYKVNWEMYKILDKMDKQGALLDPIAVERARQAALDKLQGMGADRFIKVADNMNPTEYDVQVYVTNEEIDLAVLADKLAQALQFAPEYRDQVLPQLFDTLGVGPFKAPPRQPIQPDGQPVQPGGQPQLNQQQLTTQANTLNGIR